MLPHTDGALLVKSVLTHGTTGVGLASALVTGIAWVGIHPGVAPVIAAAFAGAAMAWVERRTARRDAQRSIASPHLGEAALPVQTELHRAPAPRWTVSKRTGRPVLGWE